MAEERRIKSGILTPTMFHQLWEANQGQLDEEELKSYLLALGLAVELKDEEIFIPSLISDDNKVLDN